MPTRYWLETLGCPKNEVDSAKLEGTLLGAGLTPASEPDGADLVVVNTCAFIEAARLRSRMTPSWRCPALAGTGRGSWLLGASPSATATSSPESMPEIDLVAKFGESLLPPSVAVTRADPRRMPASISSSFPRLREPLGVLLEVAEGCDRNCGFRDPLVSGVQRSRSEAAILEEIESLGPNVREVVLVAQDLASRELSRSGRHGRGGLRHVLWSVCSSSLQHIERVRLLYLYPSSVDDSLIGPRSASRGSRTSTSRCSMSPRPSCTGCTDLATTSASGPDLTDPFSCTRGGVAVELHPRFPRRPRRTMTSFWVSEIELDWAGFFALLKSLELQPRGSNRPCRTELALERLGVLRDPRCGDSSGSVRRSSART